VRPCGPPRRFWRRTIRPLLAPIGILMLAVLAMSAKDIGPTGPAVDETGQVATEALPASGTDPMRSRPGWSADAAVLRDANGGADPAGSCRPAEGRTDAGPDQRSCASTAPDATTADPAAATQAPDANDPSPNAWRAFDAGNIISDAVFYNADSMTDDQIDEFIRVQGRD